MLVCSDILLVCKNIPVWKENTKQKPWHHKHEPLSQECNRPAIWPNFKRINVLSSNFNSNFYKLICKKKNSQHFPACTTPISINLIYKPVPSENCNIIILFWLTDWYYFSRYRLWHKSWKAWQEFINHCRRKKAKDKLAHHLGEDN